MRALRSATIALGLLCLTAVGCQNKLLQENKALDSQNRELMAQNADLKNQLASAPTSADLAQARNELAAREAEIAQLQASLQQQAVAQPVDPGLSGITTTYDPKSGEVTVNLPGDVLFESGQATLKSSATATLDKIVSAIRKDYPTKKLYVDGHTDADPIKRTAKMWDDNHDLSYHRAKAVMDYLVKHGVSDKNVVLRAYGPNDPKDGMKAHNRRVEIVVATRS